MFLIHAPVLDKRDGTYKDTKDTKPVSFALSGTDTSKVIDNCCGTHRHISPELSKKDSVAPASDSNHFARS
jgi:hypothetical protein